MIDPPVDFYSHVSTLDLTETNIASQNFFYFFFLVVVEQSALVVIFLSVDKFRTFSF